MNDAVSKQIQSLQGALPEPRLGLTEDEKDALLRAVGPRLVRDIVKASRSCPIGRVPFLFSSVNTQHVVDILANDLEAALARALPHKKS